jgi:O-antigen/teichoic acid export membrane protein
LVIGSFFVCLFRNAANYLIAANLERLFLKYIVATLVFNLLFDVGLVKAGFGMEGVAVGTSLAGFFLTTLVWRRVLMGMGFTPRQRWRAMFELYLPFFVLLTVVGVHGWLVPSLFQSFNFRSIAVGLLWVVLVNGTLWCIPMYRAEAVTWWQRIRRVRESAPPSVPVPRSAL